jgi:transglutaminase-like putative cysteine protease
VPRALSVAALWVAAGAVLGALGWPPFSTTMTLIGLPAVAVLVQLLGARRPGLLRALGLVVVLAAVARFATGLGDTHTASLGTLRDPLVELLLGLATAHSASTLERRSLRFSLGIAAALAFYAGAVRVDPGAAWWLAGWFAMTVLALAAIHRSELRSLAPIGQSFPPAGVRAVAVRSGWGLVRVVGAVAVALAVLAVVPIPAGPVQFVAPSSLPLRSPVPKPAALGARTPDGSVVVSGTAAGGGDDPATAAAFGYPAFEQSFDLSARGRPGHEVVMRVRAPAPDFWRGQTFERFDGRRWYVSDDEGRFVNGPIVPIGRLDGDVLNAPTDDMIQTYYIERDVPNLVFAAQRPVQLYLDAGVWVRPDGALRADTTLSAGTIYTVESRRSAATDEALRAQGGPTSGQLQARWKAPARARYLQLPDTTTARTKELAHAITDPYPDVYGKIRAIEGWLDANVQYDLDAPVPPAGADAVDDFLFESRRGFCEQISTALVVLLRAIGVPSREAAGYAAGQRDPVAGVWVVRGEDAHAWAEVWFPVTGWQAFDPTASVPLAGDSAGRASLGAPIVRAIGRTVGRVAPYAIVPVALAAAGWPLAVWLTRRRRARRSPAWAAQRRFERACGRVGVAVGQADSNEGLAARVADRAPPAAAAARSAGAAIDHAVFGAGDPDAAVSAVTTFEKVLAARP